MASAPDPWLSLVSGTAAAVPGSPSAPPEPGVAVPACCWAWLAGPCLGTPTCWPPMAESCRHGSSSSGLRGLQEGVVQFSIK